MKNKDKKENLDNLKASNSCRECDVLFDPEEEFEEMEKMNPKEKKRISRFSFAKAFL